MRPREIVPVQTHLVHAEGVHRILAAGQLCRSSSALDHERRKKRSVRPHSSVLIYFTPRFCPIRAARTFPFASAYARSHAARRDLLCMRLRSSWRVWFLPVCREPSACRSSGHGTASCPSPTLHPATGIPFESLGSRDPTDRRAPGPSQQGGARWGAHL